MKHVFLSLAFMGIAQAGFAQNSATAFCGTSTPDSLWEAEFGRSISAYKRDMISGAKSTLSYTIPVIFHVVHGGENIGTFPNLSQDQLNAQIIVLNQDFSGNGLNAANYPSDAFVNWCNQQALPAANMDSLGRVKIADTEIQFCLATRDTLGNILPEPGIDRIDYTARNWSNPNSFSSTITLRTYMNETIKPQSIWDARKYLNIWVSDRSSAIMFTGFATMPPLSTLTGTLDEGTDSTDGIWCYTKALGSNTLYPSGIYAAPQVEGRTITHEVGHWLGLRHIWGDGNCQTDYCDDTPPAFTQNTGNPTYPTNAGSCSMPSNATDGEMFMNFMDYPADPFKYMFTTDQKTRMQTAMASSPHRIELGTHALCDATSSTHELFSHYLYAYPNPTKDFINLFSNVEIETVKIYDYLGQLVFMGSGNGVNLSGLPDGLYMLQAASIHVVRTIRIIKN